MHTLLPSRVPGRGVWLVVASLLLILVLALGAGAPAARGQTADGEYPTDAEVAAGLEPVVLSQTRRGDETTLTVEIPAGADTFTTSNRPDTNWSNDPNMRVGFNLAQSNGAQRIYIFFDMGIIPSNANVQSAQLRMFLNSAAPTGDQNMGLLARFLSTPWDANTLTWNSYNPSWGSEIGVGQVDTIPGWKQADITGPVAQWVSGARPNNGILIQGDETPQHRERVFSTLNAGNNLHPRIVVTYSIGDNTPPTSSIRALPQWSLGTFLVEWDGSDNPGGSGVRHFDVQFRVNNGNWQNWIMATTGRSASFTGQHGNRYDFRVRAVDFANNFQNFPNNPNTSTTVDTVMPTSGMNPLPQFTFSNDFTVSWTGSDALSGIRHFDVDFKKDEGPWQALVRATTQTTAQFLGGEEGADYSFRVRAVDRAGNIQPFTSAAQAETTISTGRPQAEIVPFIPNVTQQTSFLVQWTGHAAPGSTVASYDVQVSFNDGPWQAWLSGVVTTSQTYNAQQGDGVYSFRVRARDNLGRVGQFDASFGNGMAVDNVEPFIIPRSLLPFIPEDAD